MRPKIVLGLMLFALVVIGAVVLLKRPVEKAAPVPAVIDSASVPATSVTANEVPPPAPVAALPPAPVLTPEERQAANQAEIDRLMEWSRNSDAQSLSNILLDLTNSEKDVREAAIEATKQFGSTNAIPVLKAAAINSTDTSEQIELLQAANFLSLPSLTFGAPTAEEIQAAQQRRAQHEARKAQMEQQGQSQNNTGGTDQGQGTPAPGQ